MTKAWLKYMALTVMAACMLTMAGCDKAQTGNSSSSSSSAVTSSSSSDTNVKKEAEKTVATNVYYPAKDGSRLIAVQRELPDTKDKYKAAVQSLIDGQLNDRTMRMLPEKTKVLDVTVDKGTAKVSFNKEFTNGNFKGSTAEEMLVGSVVNTLTDFAEIKKVQILIEGKPIETISGHLDLTEPLSRMSELL